MKKKKIAILIISPIILLISCRGDFWGAHDLGNNLTLLEGDKIDDRAIVYCTGKSGGFCKGGMHVIPSIGKQYFMYVDVAKANEKWVVARSIQIKDKKQSYWIISKSFNIESLNCDIVNCDSIIQSYVKGPFNINEFNQKKTELKIDLGF